MAMTADADFVFLDPDNGFEVSSPQTAKNGPKYCFYDEVQRFLRRGQSVVVYQHYARGSTIEDRVNGRFAAIARMAIDHSPLAISFSAWQLRFFYILPVGFVGRILRRKAERFVDNNVLAERWAVYQP